MQNELAIFGDEEQRGSMDIPVPMPLLEQSPAEQALYLQVFLCVWI